MSVKWPFKIDKPICYIVYGHSLKEFDDRIQEFKDLDVVWASLNRWQVAQAILEKIGKRLNYLFLFSLANGQKCEYVNHHFEASEARGNTLLESIYQCIENGVKELYIFGADGFNNQDTSFYMIEGRFNQSMYPDDLKYFNDHYPHNLIKNSGIQIFNTSQISKYCIPKITIDECIEKIKASQNLASMSS